MNSIKTYYFLGIGGIGMSALARYFHSQGHNVSGYDRVRTPLTQRLEEEGICVHYTPNVELIPSSIDMVIYTPAIPITNEEYVYLKGKNVPIKKRSQVLGEIAENKKCIAVAGSHGKTSTSGMIAYILSKSSVGCSAFLGGIAKDFDSNFVLNVDSEYVVVEADEFDRSFLQLYPMYSVITATDPDHLDIYQNHENLLAAFEQYGNQTNRDGKLFVKQSVNLGFDEDIPVSTYSLNNIESEYYAYNIRMYKGNYYFDLHTPTHIYYDMEMVGTPLYNIENAVAACAVAQCCGVTEYELRYALKTFNGIKRRFEYRIKTNDFVFIDDYAHHPKELSFAIDSIKALYPNRRIVGVFQPHLYSRTKDFAKEFAEALSVLDEIILLDIYPAREEPIPGVTSRLILHSINKMSKYLCGKEELVDVLLALSPDVLVTFGAGDIDALVPKIEASFRNELEIQ
ncbi:MAG: UDP-N-acetylmuramate--L-alanine ligase [Bacteroidales bacterium]|nr:UDP-N-acetylmuramate--L-alanine ligase [Bacteroidales bacterium]